MLDIFIIRTLGLVYNEYHLIMFVIYRGRDNYVISVRGGSIGKLYKLPK